MWLKVLKQGKKRQGSHPLALKEERVDIVRAEQSLENLQLKRAEVQLVLTCPDA